MSEIFKFLQYLSNLNILLIRNEGDSHQAFETQLEKETPKIKEDLEKVAPKKIIQIKVFFIVTIYVYQKPI